MAITEYITQPPDVGGRRELKECEEQHIICLLRAVEHLPIISQIETITTDSKEPYEVLCRRLKEIHQNHLELSRYASTVLVADNDIQNIENKSPSEHQ